MIACREQLRQQGARLGLTRYGSIERSAQVFAVQLASRLLRAPLGKAIERILDDSPYFGGNADGSNPSIGDVYEVFQSEFDVAYEEHGLFLLTMHPHMMGHRSRTAMLEKLVQYIKGKPGVWFATHEQIANHVKPLIAAQ